MRTKSMFVICVFLTGTWHSRPVFGQSRIGGPGRNPETVSSLGTQTNTSTKADASKKNVGNDSRSGPRDTSIRKGVAIPESAKATKIEQPPPDPQFGTPFSVDSIKITSVPYGNLIPANVIKNEYQICLKVTCPSSDSAIARPLQMASAKWHVRLAMETEGAGMLSLSKTIHVNLQPGQSQEFTLPFKPCDIPDLGFSQKRVDLRFTFTDVTVGSAIMTPPPQGGSEGTSQSPADIARGKAKLASAFWGERKGLFKTALPTPHIDQINPNLGQRNARIAVKGTNLGKARSGVRFVLKKEESSEAIEPRILVWEDDRIEFMAPQATGAYSAAIADANLASGSNAAELTVADQAEIALWPNELFGSIRIHPLDASDGNEFVIPPFSTKEYPIRLATAFPPAIRRGWIKRVASIPPCCNQWCHADQEYFFEINPRLGLGDCSHRISDPDWYRMTVLDKSIGYDIDADYFIRLESRSGEKIYYTGNGVTLQLPYFGMVHPTIYLTDTWYKKKWKTVHLSELERKIEGTLSIVLILKVVDHRISVESVTGSIYGDLSYLPEIDGAWHDAKGQILNLVKGRMTAAKKAFEDAMTEKIHQKIGAMKKIHNVEFVSENKVRVHYSDVQLAVMRTVR